VVRRRSGDVATAPSGVQGAQAVRRQRSVPQFAAEGQALAQKGSGLVRLGLALGHFAQPAQHPGAAVLVAELPVEGQRGLQQGTGGRIVALLQGQRALVAQRQFLAPAVAALLEER